MARHKRERFKYSRTQKDRKWDFLVQPLEITLIQIFKSISTRYLRTCSFDSKATQSENFVKISAITALINMTCKLILMTLKYLMYDVLADPFTCKSVLLQHILMHTVAF